jgi:hypothetical protein
MLNIALIAPLLKSLGFDAAKIENDIEQFKLLCIQFLNIQKEGLDLQRENAAKLERLLELHQSQSKLEDK